MKLQPVVASHSQQGGLGVPPAQLIAVTRDVRGRALVSAERFAREQPARAKALLARGFAGGSAEIEVIWPLNDFRVTLEQSLLFILESAARWEASLVPPTQ